MLRWSVARVIDRLQNKVDGRRVQSIYLATGSNERVASREGATFDMS